MIFPKIAGTSEKILTSLKEKKERKQGRVLKCYLDHFLENIWSWMMEFVYNTWFNRFFGKKKCSKNGTVYIGIRVGTRIVIGQWQINQKPIPGKGTRKEEVSKFCLFWGLKFTFPSVCFLPRYIQVQIISILVSPHCRNNKLWITKNKLEYF